MMTFRSQHQLLRGLTMAQDVLIGGPRVVTADSAVNLPASSGRQFYAIRRFENLGTTVVLWAVGAVPTPDACHGSLKACTVANDGTGGVEDFSRFNGDIYIKALTGSPRVAILEAIGIEGVDN